MAEAPAYPSLGGYDDEFVNAVEEDLQCAICQLPLKEPILTKCGHRFCRKCLDGHFGRLEREGQPLSCPVDRNNLTQDKEYIFPDKATERKILSFFIKCPSDGCQWSGELRSKEDHVASCPLKVVSCTNDNCPMSLPRKDLQGHVTTTCKWRIVRCSHCNAPHPACTTEIHQGTCERFPLTCPKNCGAIIAREEVSAHTEKDCPLTIISCPYAQMGCTTKVQRREMESHVNSASIPHLDLACVQLRNMQIHLSDTQIQLKNTQEEFKETKRELGEKVNALENQLMQCPGMHAWKISGFAEILKQAKGGGETVIKSPPFHYHEYKFRLILLPNGKGVGRNTHLSIFFHIMKGEYDALLSWPFFRKVTLTLIDQQENLNDRENLVKSINSDPENNKESCSRPVTDENVKGFGFRKFISYKKVRERRYIVDDTMFIQFQVGSPE